MVEARFTPGPWVYDGSVSVRVPYIEEDDYTSNLIALVYSRRVDGRGDIKANNALVSAAPDLFEACQKLIEWYGARGNDEKLLDPEKQEPEIRNAMLAISKAVGK